MNIHEKSTEIFWKIYVGLALVHIFLLGYQAVWNSPTRNEQSHLVAGVSHWEFQRFDLFRVNPPLVRTWAAVPVALLPHEEDWRSYSLRPTKRREASVGQAFAEVNGPRCSWLMTNARWMCIPFSLLGGWICGRWAMRLYGLPSGVLAMILWFFSPMVLGHASLITADAHSAALGVAAMYCAWNWLSAPTPSSAFVTGVAVGLAQLAKYTLLVLYPVICALGLVFIVGDAERRPKCYELLIVFVVSLSVLNLGYLFEDSFKPLKDYGFQTHLFTGLETGNIPESGAPNRFEDTLLNKIPIPVPANYLQGIDTQRRDFERAIGPSYFCGTWQDRGWWYWYSSAFALKTPLGTVALLALAIGMSVFCRWSNAPWQEELFAWLSALAVVALVSSQTGFSIHYRYIFPALPFLFIGISKVARVFEMRPATRMGRLMAAMVVVAMTWSVGSSLWAYPHSVSYFNELAGGPKGGGEHLLDSNIDWGQDLFYLKEWLDEHPEVTLDGLAYWGSYPATLAGIPETPHPPPGTEAEYAQRDLADSQDHLGPKPGWYAVSVNYLYDRSRQYRYFLDFEPVASAGYSIYIYHITLDEANRVRRELAMPELPVDWEKSVRDGEGPRGSGSEGMGAC
jgi:hypothetical protein